MFFINGKKSQQLIFTLDTHNKQWYFRRMELESYIKRQGKPYTVWAQENNLSITTISRYLRGVGKLSVENALAIEEACNEEVTLKDLLNRYKKYL